MVVCSMCRLGIEDAVEAEEKLFRAKTGEILSIFRHDACAPAGGAGLQRVSRSDLKAYLSPAMSRKNALTFRRSARTPKANKRGTADFIRNAAKVAR